MLRDLPAVDAATGRAFDLLNARFDRILVITLDRARERQERLSRRLLGLRYELFFGADKRDLAMEDLRRRGVYDEGRARRVHRHGKTMQLGEIACALSHRRVWEAVVANGWQRVLVLEDDALPDPAAMPQLAAALEELPPTWELLYLGYTKHEQVTPELRRKQWLYLQLARLRLIRWSPTEVRNLLPRPCSPHLRRAGLHDCLHAYAVTGRAARKLIAAQTPVALAADTLVSRVVMRGDLEAFVTEPRFFDQERFLDPGDPSIMNS
ncbi:MAG TPA: glycosyltransferase family 25 protein [Anaeromyxobacteraceae bacterium]|nr:glycosyltransferase family 25 protein [Anaeromyxobacteraceae bacterium]